MEEDPLQEESKEEDHLVDNNETKLLNKAGEP